MEWEIETGNISRGREGSGIEWEIETGKIKTEWKHRHRWERKNDNKDRAQADRKHGSSRNGERRDRQERSM